MTGPGLADCAAQLRRAGLSMRGAFHVEDADGVPPTGENGEGRTLVLVGNTGASFWPGFRQSCEFGDGLADPLDRWSRRVITAIACELRAHALFPFDGPPHHPFLRWAQRAESLEASPLGMLIHPEYGLWHAYRGALVFNRLLDRVSGTQPVASPCLSCAEQPCLDGCPVDAFGTRDFDADACVAHLSGDNDCLERGCLARNACPVGGQHRYPVDQHRFHLRAFLEARRRRYPG